MSCRAGAVAGNSKWEFSSVPHHLTLGLWGLCSANSNQAFLAHPWLQRLKGPGPHLDLPCSPKPGHSIYRAASLLAPTSPADFQFKAGRAACPPSPFMLLLHTSFTDTCLSRSMTKCLRPINWEQTCAWHIVDSLKLYYVTITWDAHLKCRFLGPIPGDSDVVGLGWGPMSGS